MVLDRNAPCPAGTGKKIKFCCADLAGELIKLSRMVEGEQLRAGLDYVCALEKRYPDRACLATTRAMLEATLGRKEDAAATVERVLAHAPENPVALAERARLLAEQHDFPAAIDAMQRAIRAIGDDVPSSVIEAIDTLAVALLANRHAAAARAHMLLALEFDATDDDRRAVVAQIERSAGISLLLKGDRHFQRCPDRVPWKKRFIAARRLAERACWKEAADEFAQIAASADDSPAVWHNLALLREWLDDTAGAVAALRKFATLDVLEDDAIEALALAMWLEGIVFGEPVNVHRVTFPILDIDRLTAAFSTSARVAASTVKHSIAEDQESEPEPPPKMTVALWDRAMPTSGEGIERNAVPRGLGHAFVFGKQTDRDARLELRAIEGRELEGAKALVAELAGDAIGPPSADAVLDVKAPPRLTLHFAGAYWKLPVDTSFDRRRALLAEERREMLLKHWPSEANTILDGKTPLEAALDPAYRRRLLACVLHLELEGDWPGHSGDCDALRRQLGLPEATPIDPATVDPFGLPPARLSRLRMDKLSDEQLLEVLFRTIALGARAAMRNAAAEIVERPDPDNKLDKPQAHGILAALAESSEEALSHIDHARELTVARGGSSAHWDLEELSLRLERGEADHFVRLADHLTREHIREPGVRESLAQVLMAAGFIGPDYQPTEAYRMVQARSQQEVAASAAATEEARIWVPGGASEPTGEKPVIWTPGMD